MKAGEIDFHEFVNNGLAAQGFSIIPITEEFMKKRFSDFTEFVNTVRDEYHTEYKWDRESQEYFLNPLDQKWKYSFCIINDQDELCFVNFSSVYKDIIHNHCTYASKQYRGFGFAKYHMIKLCQRGIDNGFRIQEGYWPISNNRSIILFLSMGWKIQSIRNGKDLLMTADLREVRDRTLELLNQNKS